jgi:hypothetical protein
VKDRALWDRLQAYAFPLDQNGRRLDTVLASEERIDLKRIPAAIEEYRRFLYLAATSGETVAPSPFVDRLWHRHLSETQAYTEDLCGRIIGRVIHHRTGRPYAADDPAYARTLEHYQSEFERRPDRRIWPSQWLLRAGPKVRRIFGIAILLIFALAFFNDFVLLVPVFIGSTFLYIFAYHVFGPWSFSGEGDKGWSFELSLNGSGDGDGDSGCGGD